VNEIGRACGMYGRQECVKQTLVEITDEREYLEDLGVDGRIILKRVLKKWNGGTDKIRVANARDSGNKHYGYIKFGDFLD
jgi:hypothetical protein